MTKLERLVKALPFGADGMLVTSPVNQRYLTGFDYTDGYVLVTRGRSYLLADSRYIEAARAGCARGFEVTLLEGDRYKLLNGLAEANRVRTLCYEDRTLTCAAFEGLRKKLPELQFVAADGLLEGMRMKKDADELASIVKAQRIAEEAFAHILGFIKPDMTERKVSLELEFYMRSLGSEGVAFDTIAVSGSASSLPHGVPRDVKLEKGFLTMDFGAVVDGFRSDMTRTVHIGRATQREREVYGTVLEAQTRALGLIRPGARCADVDAAARAIITDAGYGKNFGHGLGHGVGLEIHEAPRLSPMAGDSLLEAGHVVTVEPGIYLEGEFGVRIEDMVYVTEQGGDDLTRPSKELIELCV